MPFDQPSATSSYSTLQAETALCIWEELDWRTNQTNPKRSAELIRWREYHGTYALRHAALGLAGDIEALYDALPAEDWDGWRSTGKSSPPFWTGWSGPGTDPSCCWPRACRPPCFSARGYGGGSRAIRRPPSGHDRFAAAKAQPVVRAGVAWPFSPNLQ